MLNWFHPAIPLDPPPGWLVSLVYGLPPLAAVFAWHLFLQRLAHRRQHPEQDPQDPQDPEQTEQDYDRDHDGLPPHPTTAAQDPDSRATVRALLDRETPRARVTATAVQQATGLSRSRAYAVLRQERAHPASPNGHQPPTTPPTGEDP